MQEQSYQKLAQHLDKLPGGFAPSRTGAELCLLQKLFAPEEAELATHLTLEREPAPVIAARAALTPAEAEQRLDEMANKGLVFSVHSEEGPTLYQAVPFIVGIYEFQVNNLNEDLLQALHDYWSTREPRPRAQTIRQIRTIPIDQSIEPHLEALPYEQASDLVEANDRFAVAPCICRREARMTGGGCDAPEENCLLFGEFADYYVRGGMGRYIDRAEVMDILVEADAANLVLQPSNSQDVTAICCCCGCCCGVLGGIKAHPRPSEYAASPFVARHEPEVCLGCLVCLERCQMEALTDDGDRVILNADRCIGCGLCVSTCSSEALTLERKPDGQRAQVPATISDTWRIISQAQAEMR
jgi:ferredoxin